MRPRQTFSVTLLDNGLRTGPQAEQITATAGGLPTATANVVVNDADVDHFTFTTIGSPKLVGLAFSVTAQAYDTLEQPHHGLQRHGDADGHGHGRWRWRSARRRSPSPPAYGRATSRSAPWIPARRSSSTSGSGATGTSNAFTVKSQLQVASTTPAPGGMFTLPGPFTYTSRSASRSLRPRSRPVPWSLSGISGATVTGVTLLPGNTTAQFTLGGITAEGTLTASIAAGAVTDQYGFPIAAFSATYVADQANPIQPASFVSLAPAGGLVFESQGNSATLFGATDRDDYAFFVQAGQTIGAVATPMNSGVALTLALGSGTPVTGAAGQAVVLEPQDISADGIQTLHVSGSGATGFTLNIYRNAALESPAGSSNQMSIDSSAIVLPSNPWISTQGTRYAAVGTSAPVLGQTSGQITTTFANNNSQAGNMFDVTTFANAITITSLDLNLSSGTYTILLYIKAGTYVGYDTTPSAWTEVASGSVTSAGAGLPSLFTVPNIQLAANTVTGFYVTTTSSGMNYTNGSNTYSNSDLQLTLGIGKGYPFGSTFSPRTWNGTINYTVRKAPGIPDVDSYTVNLTGKAGHLVDIVLAGQQGVNFLGESLQLLGTDGTTVLATGVPNPVASGTTVTNYNLGILDFLVPTDGVYTVRLTSTTTQGSYAIVVADSLLFDSEPNNLLTNPLRTLAVGRPALGYVSASDPDCYQVVLTAGQGITATTATPFDNSSGLPGNLLVPELELYSPSGAVVATNQGGAADGHNALLSYTAPVAGTYTIEVLAAAQQGEYILGLAGLSIAVPANATKGDPPVTASVNIPAPLAGDLTISLTSSDPSRATVPASVTISAGQTSAPLPITIIDDGLLDGPEAVVITGTAAGYATTTATITIHDNQTATLSMTLPLTAHETDGTIIGTVTSGAAPARNITVQLTSSDTTRLTVPATVTLLAGQTSVNFTATLLDDHVIESGPTPVTVTSHVENWTDGARTISIVDDDRTMTVALPASGWEGQTLSGTVQLGGTLTTPLTVSLSSSDITQLTVPATVTIAAGARSATFSVTLLDNGLRTGPQSEQITATAGGLPTATANVVVNDADVDHFTFTTIGGPTNGRRAVFGDRHRLRHQEQRDRRLQQHGLADGHGRGGALAISPTSVTFVSGVWTGNVTVNAVDPTVMLHLNNGAGITSASNTFAVQPGAVATLQWSTIASPQTQNVPFSVTLTANDVNGYTATGDNGSVTLSGRTGAGSPSSQVLLFQDSNKHYFQSALSAMGLTYTSYTTDSAFETALAAANPATTLAIVDSAGNTQTFSAVPSFVSAGGEVIFEYWNLATSSSLAAAFGATTVSSFTTPLPVYDWGGSTLFTGVTSPLAFAETGWNIDGDLLQPTGSGAAVAGFQSTAAANEAALIVANSGRTILDGFLLDDAVTATQVIQFAENEIQALLNIAGSPVPMTPTTATFVNGVWTGSVTVTQAATNMYLHVDDGSGHTANSNTFNTIAHATAAPGAPSLLPVSDTGASQSDGVTNLDNSDATKTLQFSVPGATPGATVTIYADGIALGSAVATDSTTVVTTTPSPALTLADGSHVITARQTVFGEAESGDSAPGTITVDTVAPRATANLLVTGAGAPTLTGTVDDPTAAVEVSVDGQAYWAVNHGDGTWTLPAGTILAPLAAGAYDVQVTATDAAGNVGHSDVPSVQFDLGTGSVDLGGATSTVNNVTLLSGTLILSGVNSYKGGTTVSAGTLVLTSPDALPRNSIITIGSGGRVVLGALGGKATGALAGASTVMAIHIMAASAASTTSTAIAAGTNVEMATLAGSAAATLDPEMPADSADMFLSSVNSSPLPAISVVPTAEPFVGEVVSPPVSQEQPRSVPLLLGAARLSFDRIEETTVANVKADGGALSMTVEQAHVLDAVLQAREVGPTRIRTLNDLGLAHDRSRRHPVRKHETPEELADAALALLVL